MKWLEKRGLSRKSIEAKKKALGKIDNFPDLSTKSKYKTSDIIPANGTKSFDMSKATFSKENYAMVPAYNKGPIMVCTREELKKGAGRK